MSEPRIPARLERRAESIRQRRRLAKRGVRAEYRDHRRLKFTMWMAMDVPNTDFDVSVYEILANGTSIALTDDAIRARYGDSLTEAKPVKSSEAVRYEFQTFPYFSGRIAKESRLRLVLLCPNSTDAEKNYNSAGGVVEESGKSARTAHILDYHDAEHQSALELPIVK